jgi:hypothetical protein
LHQGQVCGAYQLTESLVMFDLDIASNASVLAGQYPFVGVDEALQTLRQHQVGALLVGTIDPDHADTISEHSIHVFTGADDMSVGELVPRFMHLMREALQRQSSGGGCCGGHGNEGGCCSEEASAEEHECCGGKGHDDGSECCGGKGHGASSEGCCGGHGH